MHGRIHGTKSWTNSLLALGFRWQQFVSVSTPRYHKHEIRTKTLVVVTTHARSIKASLNIDGNKYHIIKSTMNTREGLDRAGTSLHMESLTSLSLICTMNTREGLDRADTSLDIESFNSSLAQVSN